MFRRMVFAAVVFFAASVFAGEADVQVRSLLHYQQGYFAGWAVVPDWTAENRKVFGVGGLLLKHTDKEARIVQWTEIMAGGFMDETRFEPVLDIRMFNSTPRADYFAEVFQNFRLKKTVVIANILVPVLPRLKAGVEGESALEDGKQPTVITGGRANLSFSCGGKCVLGVAYLVNVTGGDDVLRVYALVNF